MPNSNKGSSLVIGVNRHVSSLTSRVNDSGSHDVSRLLTAFTSFTSIYTSYDRNSGHYYVCAWILRQQAPLARHCLLEMGILEPGGMWSLEDIFAQRRLQLGVPNTDEGHGRFPGVINIYYRPVSFGTPYSSILHWTSCLYRHLL